MSKLVLNDDGTVVVPLVDKEPIVIDEPSMRQLATMMEKANAADAALPDLVPIPNRDTLTQEQLDAFQASLRERNVAMYGSASPHGRAFIEILAMLGHEVTEDDLYGWVMSPMTLRSVLEHFQTPLGGEDREVATT